MFGVCGVIMVTILHDRVRHDGHLRSHRGATAFPSHIRPPRGPLSHWGDTITVPPPFRIEIEVTPEPGVNVMERHGLVVTAFVRLYCRGGPLLVVFIFAYICVVRR